MSIKNFGNAIATSASYADEKNEEKSDKPSYSPRLGRSQGDFDEDEEDEEDW